MGGGSVITVQIVKCPKCNTNLEEPTSVPIYKCGRCNTVLQARNYITKIEDTNSLLTETSVPALISALGHTSDNIESHCPSQNGSHIPETGNNSDQIRDCATNTEEGNISNAQRIHNELPGGDGGNYGQNELTDIAHDYKREYSEADSVSNSSGVKQESTVTRSSPPREDGSIDEANYCDVIQRQSIGKKEDYEKSFPSEYVTQNNTREYEKASATDPNSELRGKVRKMFEIATSTIGRGYDGGSSSYEDHDDQIHKQTIRDSNYVGNDGRRNIHTKKFSNLTAMQQKAKEVMNIGGYEKGGPSSDWLDRVQKESTIHSTRGLPHAEKEKIRFTKMVHDLYEDLKYKSANKRNINGRYLPNFWTGRQMPALNKYGEFMDQGENSRYPFTKGEQRTDWPRNPSLIPFSGEPTYIQHHNAYSCQLRLHNKYSFQHCHPVDQRVSAQLGPSICNAFTRNTGQEKAHCHHGNWCYNFHTSSSSSPQRHRKAEFPSRVRDVTYVGQRLVERHVEAGLKNFTISTDQKRNDEVKKFGTRERRCPARHHMRPKGGGAPFITCYHCWTTLQLPADSFLFKRRIHKLKCGSCSNILKFSLESRTHIVPHGYVALLPSEVNDRSLVKEGTTHPSISCHSHIIQTSCSDNEFGNSYCRSCSTTEGEQVSLVKPSHAIQASNVDGKEIPYKDSSDILDGRKKQFSKDLSSKASTP